MKKGGNYGDGKEVKKIKIVQGECADVKNVENFMI